MPYLVMADIHGDRYGPSMIFEGLTEQQVREQFMDPLASSGMIHGKDRQVHAKAITQYWIIETPSDFDYQRQRQKESDEWYVRAEELAKANLPSHFGNLEQNHFLTYGSDHTGLFRRRPVKPQAELVEELGGLSIAMSRHAFAAKFPPGKVSKLNVDGNLFLRVDRDPDGGHKLGSFVGHEIMRLTARVDLEGRLEHIEAVMDGDRERVQRAICEAYGGTPETNQWTKGAAEFTRLTVKGGDGGKAVVTLMYTPYEDRFNELMKARLGKGNERPEGFDWTIFGLKPGMPQSAFLAKYPDAHSSRRDGDGHAYLYAWGSAGKFVGTFMGIDLAGLSARVDGNGEIDQVSADFRATGHDLLRKLPGGCTTVDGKFQWKRGDGSVFWVEENDDDDRYASPYIIYLCDEAREQRYRNHLEAIAKNGGKAFPPASSQDS